MINKKPGASKLKLNRRGFSHDRAPARMSSAKVGPNLQFIANLERWHDSPDHGSFV
jgi:hypothetical protein